MHSIVLVGCLAIPRIITLAVRAPLHPHVTLVPTLIASNNRRSTKRYNIYHCTQQHIQLLHRGAQFCVL
jgi:hypothetical protein